MKKILLILVLSLIPFPFAKALETLKNKAPNQLVWEVIVAETGRSCVETSIYQSKAIITEVSGTLSYDIEVSKSKTPSSSEVFPAHPVFMDLTKETLVSFESPMPYVCFNVKSCVACTFKGTVVAVR